MNCTMYYYYYWVCHIQNFSEVLLSQSLSGGDFLDLRGLVLRLVQKRQTAGRRSLDFTVCELENHQTI
jgi:hypothetical protein